MRGIRSQRGQASIEWVGVAFVVVALAIGLSAAIPGVAGSTVGAVQRAVCKLGGGSCGGGGTAKPAPPGGAPTVTPVTAVAYNGKPTPTPGPTPTPTPSAPPTQNPQAAGVPTPNPQPQAPPPNPADWRWPASAGTHADQLPTNGDRPYSPPKKGRGNPVRGNRGGYVDEDGNVWEWAKGGGQHGGPHWDVQHPDGSHTNVAPDGTIIGKDNFPNKRRQPKQPEGNKDDGGGNNTAKAVGVAAGAAGTGALIWWLGKLASPVCGPFAPLCAIAF